MTNKVTKSLMTIFIGLNIGICVTSAILSIDLLRSSTNPVVALQPINPLTELGYFQYLKQISREQNLKRKRTTVELCDGATNLVVVKAKIAKSVPYLTEIDIDTLG